MEKRYKKVAAYLSLSFLFFYTVYSVLFQLAFPLQICQEHTRQNPGGTYRIDIANVTIVRAVGFF
jgi:hypothetical protein